ncbi:MAG: hypothetical protein K2H38_12810 [Muribaculaceae bacterium]|nr:hypothetical protein [Muribaculaceae bacterium]MDE6553154.1 hypothetical protein [Muribaculaceae bacterium]
MMDGGRMARITASEGGVQCGEKGMRCVSTKLDASGSDGRDERSEAFGLVWERPQGVPGTGSTGGLKRTAEDDSHPSRERG